MILPLRTSLGGVFTVHGMDTPEKSTNLEFHCPIWLTPIFLIVPWCHPSMGIVF